MRWFVAYTQPAKESIAQKHLCEQGFEVYWPRFKKTRRHARKTEEVLAPLFPRYLFVGMNLETAPWRSVNGTRGVSHLLTGSDNRPAEVPEGLVETLRAQENAEGVVPLRSLVFFAKGDTVRVLEGPFQEYMAVFEGLDDKQRAQLLLSFMGREMAVSVPAGSIEAV